MDQLVDPLPFWIFMGANMAVSVCLITAACVYAYRHRDALPFYCMVGGALAMISTEPMIDHLLLVWYPVNSPWVVGYFFDIGLPAYLLFGYPWYVGLGAFAVCQAIERGVSRRRLWQAYGIVAVLDFVIELPSTAAGVHIYYGTQPNFFEHGLAVSIPFVMSAVTMLAGFTLYHVLQRVTGWRARLATIVAIPSSAVATLVGTQWPLMVAQNSGASAVAVWTTAFIAIGISLGATWFALSTMPTSRDTLPSNAANAQPA